MPVTVNYYSDRRAAQILRVVGKPRSASYPDGQPTQIAIKFNQTKTIDYYAGTYEILKDQFEGSEMWFTKRKNGRWVHAGENLHKGLGLSLNIHDHYIDPSY